MCLGDGHTAYTAGLSGSEECVWGGGDQSVYLAGLNGFERCVWGMVILSTLLC